MPQQTNHHKKSELSLVAYCCEQFGWNLPQRGIADIDIPGLILGIAA